MYLGRQGTWLAGGIFSERQRGGSNLDTRKLYGCVWIKLDKTPYKMCYKKLRNQFVCAVSACEEYQIHITSM